MECGHGKNSERVQVVRMKLNLFVYLTINLLFQIDCIILV